MASKIFKAALATPATPHPPATDSSASSTTGKLLSLLDDDGDALLLICYIFHFRSDLLPNAITSDTLLRMGVLATKYQCINAISRTTSPWFDRIYSANDANDTLKMIQATYLLDEPIFFARFTSRSVKTTQRSLKPPAGQAAEKIAGFLHTRQLEATSAMRLHLDILIEPCAEALGKASHHYIDCPPGMEPDTDDLPTTPSGEPGRPVTCAVDSQAAPLYLGALRDAGLWPTISWGGKTIEELIQAVREIRIPDYDDCDKCDCCLPLTEVFADKLALVKKLQDERLWGLCLDCFKAGGLNQGECRQKHGKGPGV
jgi:hypothetical protein